MGVQGPSWTMSKRKRLLLVLSLSMLLNLISRICTVCSFQCVVFIVFSVQCAVVIVLYSVFIVLFIVCSAGRLSSVGCSESPPGIAFLGNRRQGYSDHHVVRPKLKGIRNMVEAMSDYIITECMVNSQSLLCTIEHTFNYLFSL